MGMLSAPDMVPGILTWKKVWLQEFFGSCHNRLIGKLFGGGAQNRTGSRNFTAGADHNGKADRKSCVGQMFLEF